MIYEIKRIDDIDMEGIPAVFAYQSLFINTKNICSIEIYCDEKYTDANGICKGLLINGQKYPLYYVSDFTLTAKPFEKRNNEYECWLDNIFNEIVEIMKKENS